VAMSRARNASHVYTNPRELHQAGGKPAVHLLTDLRGESNGPAVRAA
jgi:hypothetical protein